MKQNIATIANEIVVEVHKAQVLFPAIHNTHEGLAVILEEFEEFKEEVFIHNLRKGRDTRTRQRDELIQVAAMAIRTILDCDLQPESAV